MLGLYNVSISIMRFFTLHGKKILRRCHKNPIYNRILLLCIKLSIIINKGCRNLIRSSQMLNPYLLLTGSQGD